jgi:hypothetical protein
LSQGLGALLECGVGAQAAQRGEHSLATSAAINMPPTPWTTSGLAGYGEVSSDNYWARWTWV